MMICADIIHHPLFAVMTCLDNALISGIGVASDQGKQLFDADIINAYKGFIKKEWRNGTLIQKVDQGDAQTKISKITGARAEKIGAAHRGAVGQGLN